MRCVCVCARLSECMLCCVELFGLFSSKSICLDASDISSAAMTMTSTEELSEFSVANNKQTIWQKQCNVNSFFLFVMHEMHKHIIFLLRMLSEWLQTNQTTVLKQHFYAQIDLPFKLTPIHAHLYTLVVMHSLNANPLSMTTHPKKSCTLKVPKRVRYSLFKCTWMIQKHKRKHKCTHTHTHT